MAVRGEIAQILHRFSVEVGRTMQQRIDTAMNRNRI